jgi:hypothetical protein
MIRTLAGAAAGIAIAIVLMMIVEAIGNQLFPPPPIDLQNPDAPAALPFENLIFPVIGWFLATLIGGWAAIQLSERRWTSWIVAASILVGELLDYLLGRHPVWMMVAGVLVPIAAALIAQKLPRWDKPASA